MMIDAETKRTGDTTKRIVDVTTETRGAGALTEGMMIDGTRDGSNATMMTADHTMIMGTGDGHRMIPGEISVILGEIQEQNHEVIREATQEESHEEIQGESHEETQEESHEETLERHRLTLGEDLEEIRGTNRRLDTKKDRLKSLNLRLPNQLH